MSWQLAHQDHAIERVSISFQFTEPLPSKLWQAMLASAETDLRESGFVGVPNEPGLMPPLGVQGPPAFEIIIQGGNAVVGLPHGPQATPAGRAFRVTNGSEITEEVSLSRVQFTYTATVYDRWTRFRGRAEALLGRYIDQALSLVDIGLIKMEYWDRFVFDGPPDSVDYSTLLRANSKHVPCFYISTKELWHSHVGYFMNASSAQRRLLHINVDVLDLLQRVASDVGEPASPRRSVGVYSMVQDTFGAADTTLGDRAYLSTLDEMHTILKSALLDVITDQVAERISLNAGARP